MLAVLGLSLGAQAGNIWKVEEALNLTIVDTSSYIVATKINDTIGPWTIYFGANRDWTQMTGRIIQVTADTCTATGLSRDSVYFKLQTKMDHDSDLTWYTIWTSSLFPMASLDSAAGWARGAATRIIIPADTVSVGDYYRMQVYLIAEEDSLRQEQSGGYLNPVASFVVYLLFRLR